ncbi:MAG TPA: VTT domain-containing protein [Stellaceae bacterium]|nr:VTT domain-containing protein [Stellaceae bacterium]
MGAALTALLNDAPGHPVLQSIMIVIGTFILEDAATVLTALRVDEGALSTALALGALYAGIALGDFGLYGLGRLSTRIGWVRRLMPRRKTLPAKEWLQRRLGVAVLSSRFLPGFRLPTYTACGYLGVPFWRFAGLVVIGTLVWTSLLFTVSMVLGDLMLRYLGEWRWASAIGLVLAVILIGRAIARLRPEVA